VIRCDRNVTSNQSFWQRLSSPTDDVELELPEMPDSVALPWSSRLRTRDQHISDWKTIRGTIVGHSVVVAEWRSMKIPSSLRVTSSIRHVSVNKYAEVPVNGCNEIGTNTKSLQRQLMQATTAWMLIRKPRSSRRSTAKRRLERILSARWSIKSFWVMTVL